MEGFIVSIHIASAPGAPMTAITSAHVVPGRGIEGDRFYALPPPRSRRVCVAHWWAR